MKKCIYLAYDEYDFNILKKQTAGKWNIKLLFDNTNIIEILKQENYDFILFDIEAGGYFPTDILRQIQDSYPLLPIFILTHSDNSYLRNDFFKYSITDFFELPTDLSSMVNKIESFFNQNKTVYTRNSFASDRKIEYLKDRYPRILGKSSAIYELKNFIHKSAEQDFPVLLNGETGTGKTMIAQIIHHNSNFKAGRFQALNVSCIPESLAEATLFGAERGSFTGAELQEGIFASADGGTIFLDELENLSLKVQAKLLTAIETKEIRPIGSARTKKINFRLICATNKNLKNLINENKFRKDLYYRLDVLHHTITPLRERKEDIYILVKDYLAKKNKEITAEAINKLTFHDWPGNVRELFNCLDRACCNFCEEDLIKAKYIEF